MCAQIATKDNSFMDDELFRRCLDQAAAHGINNVVFAAAYGEALLHPKGIQYLAEAADRGFQVTIATNGTFLQPTQIREVAALKLDLIQYSFFGYDKRSYEKTYAGGNFEKAAENLRLMKATLVEFGSSTKFTVNGVNITGDAERTRKTREFLRTLGIRDEEMRLQVPCNFGGHISPGFKSNKLNAKSFKPIDRLPFYICPLLLSTPGIFDRWPHDGMRLHRQQWRARYRRHPHADYRRDPRRPETPVHHRGFCQGRRLETPILLQMRHPLWESAWGIQRARGLALYATPDGA